MRQDNYTLFFIRCIKVVINGKLVRAGGDSKSLRQTGGAGYPIFANYDNFSFCSTGHLGSSLPCYKVVSMDPGEIRTGSEIFVPHTSFHLIFSTGGMLLYAEKSLFT